MLVSKALDELETKNVTFTSKEILDNLLLNENNNFQFSFLGEETTFTNIFHSLCVNLT